jgi:hypothetical protein
MSQSAYPPNGTAVLDIVVTLNGLPVAGVEVTAQFDFPGGTAICIATTDASGKAACTEAIPNLPEGTEVSVDVQVGGPNGQTASALTQFVVHRGSP